TTQVCLLNLSYRGKRQDAVGHRRKGSRITVGVLLIAAKYDDVAGLQSPIALRNAQFDDTGLAGQVLPSSWSMRNTCHVGCGSQFHAIDLESRDRLRQQPSSANLSTLRHRKSRSLVESHSAARRSDQFFNGDLKRIRDFDQN